MTHQEIKKYKEVSVADPGKEELLVRLINESGNPELKAAFGDWYSSLNDKIDNLMILVKEKQQGK